MIFFFFNDTATTEIYTLSLHDALPICGKAARGVSEQTPPLAPWPFGPCPGGHTGWASPPAPHSPALQLGLRRAAAPEGDRKSTRLNSSHANISYAVFCLKKKKINCLLN